MSWASARTAARIVSLTEQGSRDERLHADASNPGTTGRKSGTARVPPLRSRALGWWPDLDGFDLDWMDDRFLPE